MDFQEVFSRLYSIYDPYLEELDIVNDEPGNLYLNTKISDPKGRAVYFGGVKIGKRYVSFHFMPVYVDPSLLEDISPALRKRMQGKSCFNFTKVDEPLFEELKALVHRGYLSYKNQSLI